MRNVVSRNADDGGTAMAATLRLRLLNRRGKVAATFFIFSCGVIAFCASCGPAKAVQRGATPTPVAAATSNHSRSMQGMPKVAQPVQARLVLDLWPLGEKPQRLAAQNYAAARRDCGKSPTKSINELNALFCSDETNMAAVEPLVQSLASLPQQHDLILHAIARRLANLHDRNIMSQWKQQHLSLAPMLADLIVALQPDTSVDATATLVKQELETWAPAAVESETGCARTIRTAIISAATGTSTYVKVHGIADALRPNCEYARRIYCETKMHGEATHFADARQNCAVFFNEAQINEALFSVAYRSWPTEPSNLKQWYRTWADAISAMPHPSAEILAVVALENALSVSARDRDCEGIDLVRLAANGVLRNRAISTKLPSRWQALAHASGSTCVIDN